MNLQHIGKVLLDESSPAANIRQALDDFSELCQTASGIAADPSFSAWAEDSFLSSGVAINPQAAAHCVQDYQRSLMFIRAVNAGIEQALLRFPAEPVRILYAGCGPYATLLLPILERFSPQRLELQLLDMHQQSLDSVAVLLEYFALGEYQLATQCCDASNYTCPQAPHLVVVETMQKALEQEPQFAITARLAPQLHSRGIFIPERIEVSLDLVNSTRQHPLASLLTLEPAQLTTPVPVDVCLPELEEIGSMRAQLVTDIQLFGDYHLHPGEAEITLPRPCPELQPLQAGERYRIQYQQGSYPVFEITALANNSRDTRSPPA